MTLQAKTVAMNMIVQSLGISLLLQTTKKQIYHTIGALDHKALSFFTCHQIGHLLDHGIYNTDSAYHFHPNLSILFYLAL